MRMTHIDIGTVSILLIIKKYLLITQIVRIMNSPSSRNTLTIAIFCSIHDTQRAETRERVVHVLFAEFVFTTVTCFQT